MTQYTRYMVNKSPFLSINSIKHLMFEIYKICINEPQSAKNYIKNVAG